MYIKNHQFNDEDTLFEVLFDFEIGESTPYMQGIVADITRKLDGDKLLKDHMKAMEEEDALELYDDLRREKIVDQLRDNFTSFVVENAGFYGVCSKGRCLLYTIDLF